MREVTVTGYGRLHFTLVDLGRVTPRAFGGCGMAISLPVVRVSIAPHNALVFEGLAHVDERARVDLHAAASRLESFVRIPICAHVCVREDVLQHVGLGSKTAMLLALLAGLNSALDLDVSVGALQTLSGRGGTSGVGIHTFFRGGFVVDAGHDTALVPELLPSAARLPERVPPLVSRILVPSDWAVWLILTDTPRIAGQDELAFFRSNTPLAQERVGALALVSHGIAPAFADANLGQLGAALRSLHTTGFKAREVANQSPVVRQLLELCWSLPQLAAGLSSMGPLIYVITGHDGLPSSLHSAVEAAAARLIGPLAGWNEGATLDLS